MIRHKRTLLAVAVVCAMALAYPTATLHFRAASVLTRFSDAHDNGRLANFNRSAIDEKPFCFAGKNEQLCGRIYSPRDIDRAPGIVLLHGVHWLGIDEP